MLVDLPEGVALSARALTRNDTGTEVSDAVTATRDGDVVIMENSLLLVEVGPPRHDPADL